MRIKFISPCFWALLSITIPIKSMEKVLSAHAAEVRAAQQDLVHLSLTPYTLANSDLAQLKRYLNIAITAENLATVRSILTTKDRRDGKSIIGELNKWQHLSFKDQQLLEPNPFILAAARGNKEIISAFFNSGLNKAALCVKGGFYTAFESRNLELITHFMSLGAFPHQENTRSIDDFLNYFRHACGMKFFEVIPLLFANTSYNERSKLFKVAKAHDKTDGRLWVGSALSATITQDPQIMEYLIAQKLITAEEIETVFLHAVEMGAVQLVRTLLGHAVSIKGDTARKAVIKAIYAKKKEALLVLLDSGFESAKLNCADVINAYEPPIIDAYKRPIEENDTLSEVVGLIELLAARGAFFKNENCECHLPALAAAPDGLPFIKFLASKGINLAGTDGSQALISAVDARRVGTVKFLVSNGVSLGGDIGQAALLHFCGSATFARRAVQLAEATIQEMIDFLVANGADCKGIVGKKLLVKAIESKNKSAFDRLLFHGAATQSEQVGEVLAAALNRYVYDDYFIDKLINPDLEIAEVMRVLLPHAHLVFGSLHDSSKTFRAFPVVLQRRILSAIKKGKFIERAPLESAEAAISPEEKNDDWKQKGRVMGALKAALKRGGYEAVDHLTKNFRFRGEVFKAALESNNTRMLNLVLSSLTPWLSIHKESQEYDFDLDKALQAGLDVSSILENGSPLLHELIWDPSKFKRLLAAGSNVNAVDSTGQTVLHKLCGIDVAHIDMTNLSALLHTPIFVNARDLQGATALHIAAQIKIGNEQAARQRPTSQEISDLYDKQRHIILTLLEKKADTSLQDRNGHSVLHLYVQAQARVLKELLKNDPVTADGSLKTLTNKACLDLIELLLRRGADPRQKNLLGQTVMDIMDILPLTDFPTQEARLLLKAAEKELNERYTKIIQNSKNGVILILLIAIAYYQLHQSGII